MTLRLNREMLQTYGRPMAASSTNNNGNLIVGFSSFIWAVSGGNLTQGWGVTNPRWTTLGNNLIASNRNADFLFVHGLVMIAGADTVITSYTCAGMQGRVVCQANSGGMIAAIVCCVGMGGRMDTANNTDVIQTTGTAPIAATSDLYCYTGRPQLRFFDAVSTAIGTTPGTITVAGVGTGALTPIGIAVAVNDVNAANNCVWSGTATSLTEDNQEAAINTNNRRSHASLAGNGTVISTWDVASTVGCSLAVAVFGN